MAESFDEMVEKATPTRVGTHPDTVRRVLTAAGVHELLEENERLREALKEIIGQSAPWATRIARAALDPEDPSNG